MKSKLLLTATLLAAITLSNFKASAQADTHVTTATAVNIVLADAFSIVLGATPDVTFNYATAADYAASKTVKKTDHFNVISNKSYSLTVKANSAFNIIAGNATPVPLSVVTIGVDASTPATGATYATPALSTTDQALATTAAATTSTAYTINYNIPSAAPLLGKVPGTYTTNVVYTITQP